MAKRWVILVELFLAFLIYNCVNAIFFPKDPAFMGFKISPYWIIILLLSLRYGLLAGILAGLSSCLNTLFFMFKGLPAKDDIEKIIESGNFTIPLLFIIVGLLVGAFRQGSINELEEERKIVKEKDKYVKELAVKYEALEKIRKVLEARIVGATTTVKTIYIAAQKIETLDTKSIYSGCLDILTSHFHVEKASLYIKEGSYFSLKACLGWSGGESSEGKVLAEESIMNLSFMDNKTITVKDILDKDTGNKYIKEYGKVLAVIPIRDKENNPVGAVNIEKMDFLFFTIPNIELIELVVDWVARALDNKKLYDMAKTEGSREIQSGIYSYANFMPALQNEFKRAEKYKLDMTLGMLKIDRYGFYNSETQEILYEAALAVFRRRLNEIDMIFKYKFDGTFAVISPLRKEEDLYKDFTAIKSELDGLNVKSLSPKEKVGIVFGAESKKPSIKDPIVFVEVVSKKANIQNI